MKNNIKTFVDFINESQETSRPKLYTELVRPLKDLYNESDNETKETLKNLSDELFKNPKDIVNRFTGKISKFKTLNELIKNLKYFLKIIGDLNQFHINESQEEYTVPIEANSRYTGTSVKDGKTYLLVVGRAEKLMGDVEIFDNTFDNVFKIV